MALIKVLVCFCIDLYSTRPGRHLKHSNSQRNKLIGHSIKTRSLCSSLYGQQTCQYDEYIFIWMSGRSWSSGWKGGGGGSVYRQRESTYRF